LTEMSNQESGYCEPIKQSPNQQEKQMESSTKIQNPATKFNHGLFCCSSWNFDWI